MKNPNSQSFKVSVIGAGLAGCEAASTLAENGIEVDLYEMKPLKFTKAHSYTGFAELVCSNSLKASRLDSAAGLLKEEMRMLGSLTLKAADSCSVAAGGALAVDRELFSDYVTASVKQNKLINIINGEVDFIPDGYCIIASGPLTTEPLTRQIELLVKSGGLSFFDAAAPIVTAQSIDMDIAFKASRYGKSLDTVSTVGVGEGEGTAGAEEGDYINCPMNKEEYEAFFKALVEAQTAELHSADIDKSKLRVYEGCMPIEVMAKRGADTMRFGPLKPVGLRDPKTGHRPWAVVQLRQENKAAALYNMVGFQTNLKFPEQKRVFSLIPGLQNAEFMRYGVMHRNTFIDSPRLLDSSFCLNDNDRIYFAGQITGVEGYMESAASGIIAAQSLCRRLLGKPPLILPKTTMLGALSHYISDESVANFQPMGSNMGILPALENPVRDKKLRYQALAQRAVEALKSVISVID